MAHEIEEFVVPGKRLGRHVNHDPRSLNFLVPKLPDEALKTTLWNRDIPVLDQGDTGSCTGNAACGALGSDPIYPGLVALNISIKTALNETYAREVLYHLATTLDAFDGTYPPTDTGSDGLSVAKACQKLGLISSYVHATSLQAAVSALQRGPVITGVNWYEGFDNPDAQGRVNISGAVRGGHEFELLGVDVDQKIFLAVNSWGTGYGNQGKFQFSYDDFDRLLHEEGDVTQFVPLTATPTPTPTPTNDADHALMASMDPWEKTIVSRITKAGKAKAAYDAWKQAKGY